MKNKSIKDIMLLALGLLIVSATNGQDNAIKKRSDLAEEGLTGSVREIETNYFVDNVIKGKTTTRYDTKGNMTERNYTNFIPGSPAYKENVTVNRTVYRYDPKGNMLEKTVEAVYEAGKRSKSRNSYTYDQSGLCTGIRFFKEDGSPGNRITYRYDKMGNIVEIMDSGLLGSRTLMQYDEKGNKKEMKTYDMNDSLTGTETYRYNNKGQCTRVYVSNNSYTGETVYTYDEKGKMVKKTESGVSYEEDQFTMKGNGQPYRDIYIYKYDEKGRLAEENVLDSLYYSKPVYRYTYSYDDKGNKTEQRNYDQGGKLEKTSTFQYDETGNWIQQVITSGGVVSKWERKISYY